MRSSSMRRSPRVRSATLRSLRPKVDHLESRELLSTASQVAQPMFELGTLVSDPNPPSGAYTPAQIQQAYQFNKISFNGVTGNGNGETIANLSTLSGCSDASAVGVTLQKNFKSIFPDASVSDTQVSSSVLTVLRSDKTLGCSKLI